MSALPLVHYERSDVDVRLSRLGLDVRVIGEAVVEGEIARVGCTSNMPPCFPGITAWAFTVAELRDRLIPAGWVKSDAGNYPIISSPNAAFAIGVATGNEHTGNRHHSPKTKFPKGPATIEKVEYNGQYSLFGDSEVVTETAPAPERLTWLLLIARCADDVRCELSLPNSIGEDGRVDGWAERIILPTVDPSDGSGLPIPLPEPGPDFDVQIARRA